MQCTQVRTAEGHGDELTYKVLVIQHSTHSAHTHRVSWRRDGYCLSQDGTNHLPDLRDLSGEGLKGPQAVNIN